MFKNANYLAGPIRVSQHKYKINSCKPKIDSNFNNSMPECYRDFVDIGYIDITMYNTTETNEILNYITDNNWINDNTAIVDVSLNFINTNQNIMFATRLSSEFDVSGNYNSTINTVTGITSEFFPPSVNILIYIRCIFKFFLC